MYALDFDSDQMVRVDKEFPEKETEYKVLSSFFVLDFELSWGKYVAIGSQKKDFHDKETELDFCRKKDSLIKGLVWGEKYRSVARLVRNENGNTAILHNPLYLWSLPDMLSEILDKRESVEIKSDLQVRYIYVPSGFGKMIVRNKLTNSVLANTD